MKRVLVIACSLLCLSAFAQTQESGILDRFTDPSKGRTVFISKGHRAAGVSGTYRYFNAGGEQDGDGYHILSMLNIGNGSLHYYSIAPSYSWFAADDFSIGVRLEYTGYTLDSDLKLDLRQATGSDDPELNLRLMCRHMHSNSFGASLAARRYVSFFGSKMFAVFGEGRLYGNYGWVKSWPLDEENMEKEGRRRNSTAWGAGIKVAGGLCVRLRDNSALTLSVPIMSVGYSHTLQDKQQGVGMEDNQATMSSFGLNRNAEVFSIHVGFVRYMLPKKKR